MVRLGLFLVALIALVLLRRRGEGGGVARDDRIAVLAARAAVVVLAVQAALWLVYGLGILSALLAWQGWKAPRAAAKVLLTLAGVLMLSYVVIPGDVRQPGGLIAPALLVLPAAVSGLLFLRASADRTHRRTSPPRSPAAGVTRTVPAGAPHRRAAGRGHRAR